jgi:polysaccharide export outer membrane protein
MNPNRPWKTAGLSANRTSLPRCFFNLSYRVMNFNQKYSSAGLKKALMIGGCLFLLININGCSAVNSPSVDKTDATKTDIAQAAKASQAKENNDLERLAQLWERRKRESLASDYPIGPGDVIEINVSGMEEIKNVSERVTGEGTISLPFAGMVHAGGMTDKSLREEIRRRLETNYMRNPQITLFVKEFRSRQVAVIGAVQKPGLYNLASSADTVLGMISQAGGMRAEAAERILFIPADPVDFATANEVVNSLPAHLGSQDPSPLILKSADPIVISLDSISRNGQEKYLNLPARPGDVIMVPGGGEVLVQGWVAKPGAYKITSGLTMLGAVAAAGGAPFPADTGSVELIRTSNQGQKTSFVADLDAIKAGKQPDLPLREGDVIDVSSSSPKLVAYGIYRFFTSTMSVGASIPVR